MLIFIQLYCGLVNQVIYFLIILKDLLIIVPLLLFVFFKSFSFKLYEEGRKLFALSIAQIKES